MVQANAMAIGEAKLALTISVGVAEATARASGIEAVLRDADKALYEAKQNGRNQVRVARQPTEAMSAAAE
jgi:diguanylate cyclase (GGDEF)-like protein